MNNTTDRKSVVMNVSLKRAEKFNKGKESGCYLTNDPNDADLFLIPLHLKNHPCPLNPDEDYYQVLFFMLLGCFCFL